MAATITVLICLAALFSYVNHRWLGLPMTIGLMAVSLIFSLVILGLGKAGVSIATEAEQFIQRIDFNETVLHGMLGLFLFAAALQVQWDELLDMKWVVASFAFVGTMIAAAVIGLTAYVVFSWLGLGLPFLYCLIFGALMAPTDPIAVMGILRQAGLPKALELKIVGESLFNDGIALVVFLLIRQLLWKPPADFIDAAVLFLQETVGAAALGLGLGYVTYRLLKSVDQYQVEILLTLALVMGGYLLAEQLHTSGPITVVVAGLLIGNQGRQWAMSQTTRQHLDLFWELLDDLLNAVVFLLIGLEVVVIALQAPYLLAGAAAIPIVLLARWISVVIQVKVWSTVRDFTERSITVLTWGALRGGISVALALSLPSGPPRDAIVTITYIVVVFSILVQGLSLKTVLQWKRPV